MIRGTRGEFIEPHRKTPVPDIACRGSAWACSLPEAARYVTSANIHLSGGWGF
jgi:hypothetical protein